MTYDEMEQSLFPISLYVYDENGKYAEPVQIVSERQLNGPGVRFVLQDAVASKRKVVMTDPLDNCLFHAEGGKILFPPQTEEQHGS